MDDAISKDFFTPRQNIFMSILTIPVTKFQFMMEKNSIREYLKKQHGIINSDEAFLNCNNAHELLSKFLGSKKFFFSKNNRKEHPRCADLIVYSYLSYELRLTPEHLHVVRSLMKYKNLIDFIGRIESCIKLKQRAGINIINDFHFVIQNYDEEEEFYISKVYEHPLEIAHDYYQNIKYKLGGDEPLLRIEQSDSKKRRAYITGGVLAIMLFAYLKKKSN